MTGKPVSGGHQSGYPLHEASSRWLMSRPRHRLRIAFFLVFATAFASLSTSGARATGAPGTPSPPPVPTAQTPTPRSTPGLKGLPDRQEVMTPQLQYEKALAERQFGRRRSGTVLFIEQHGRQSGAGTSLFTEGTFDVQLPIDGFSPDTGLLNEGSAHLPAPVLPWRPTAKVAIEDQFNGDSGEETSPLDTQISVGSGYVLQVDNTNLTVWDKARTSARPLTFPLTDRNVFNLDPTTYHVADPWLVYDGATHRWFLSAMITDASTCDNYLRCNEYFGVAVSRQDDPTSAWTVTRLDFDDEFDVARDQPKMAILWDRVVIAWDDFLPPSADPRGGNWTIFPKGSVLPGSKSKFAVATAYKTSDPCLMHPIPVRDLSSANRAIIVSSTIPRPIAACNGTVVLPRKSRGNVVTAVTVDGMLPHATISKKLWQVNEYSAPGDPAQRGSSEKLFAGDSRILSALAVGDQVYLAAGDACAASISCARVWVLDLANKGIRPVEDFDVGLAQHFIFYPSLAVDANGNIIGIASDIAENGYLGAIVFYRLAGERNVPLMGPVATGHIVMDCPAPSPLNETRVGDYSSADTDPTSRDDVWLTAGIAPASPPAASPPYQYFACPQASVIGKMQIK
jgi:hypothetical protein